MSDRQPDPERIARVVGALAVGERDPGRALCAASADVVGVRSAGVVLISRGRPLGTVCVSDAAAERVEDVQYTLGQGPCIDAFASKERILAPDLAGVDYARWPEFCQRAVAEGVVAAFGFPILVGPVSIGALNLYHDRSGSLSDEQERDASAVALVIGQSVIRWQSGAPDGSVAWQLEQAPAHRAVVHQAAGMVSVQANLSVDDASTLLRAYSFAEGEPVTGVAEAVVGGRLRFDDV